MVYNAAIKIFFYFREIQFSKLEIFSLPALNQLPPWWIAHYCNTN